MLKYNLQKIYKNIVIVNVKKNKLKKYMLWW